MYFFLQLCIVLYSKIFILLHILTCFTISGPGAPEIEIPQEYLNEVKHKAGSNVELKFNIRAKPAPSIEWFKDGRELKPTSQLSFKHTFESTSVFVKETTRLNSGTYEVKVKNSLGSSCAIVRLLIQGIYLIFIFHCITCIIYAVYTLSQMFSLSNQISQAHLLERFSLRR